jgi:hypothetical protein
MGCYLQTSYDLGSLLFFWCLYKIIKLFIKRGYDPTACLVFNTFTVGRYAFLFWIHLSDQVGDSMMDISESPLGLNCLNVHLLSCFVGPLLVIFLLLCLPLRHWVHLLWSMGFLLNVSTWSFQCPPFETITTVRISLCGDSFYLHCLKCILHAHMVVSNGYMKEYKRIELNLNMKIVL